MAETIAGDVTMLLSRWGDGDQSAAGQLMPLVYRELRQMARSYLRGERSTHTLQPTALVHEAYIRLAEDASVNPACRSHFFGMASTTMRRVLVEHARAKCARKRGSGVPQISLDGFDVASSSGLAEIIELHEALDALAKLDPRKGRLIELKFFGGLTIDEMAGVVNVSAATVERDLKVAQVWLYRRLANAA